MKIYLVFYDVFRKAGIQRVVINLANSFQKNGDEVTIIVADSSLSPAFSIHRDIKLISVNLPEVIKGTIFSKLVWFIKFILKLHLEVKKGNPDILLDNGTLFGYLWPFEKFYNAPLILFRHFTVTDYPNGHLKFFIIKLLNRYKKIVVLNRKTKNDLNNLGFTNVEVIPNYVNIEHSHINVGQKKQKRILAIGRPVPQKGFDILLEAFYRLKLNHGLKGYTLTLIGDGMPYSDLTVFVDLYSLHDDVLLLDKVDDLSRYFTESEIFVLPSRYEGMPMVILEAMTAECLIIASDIIGVSDLLTHEYNSLLFNVGNVDDLVKLLNSVIEQRINTEELILNSKFAVQNFSENNIIEKWLNYLKPLIN